MKHQFDCLRLRREGNGAAFLGFTLSPPPGQRYTPNWAEEEILRKLPEVCRQFRQQASLVKEGDPLPKDPTLYFTQENNKTCQDRTQ